MGLIRLRDTDIDLARSHADEDPDLDHSWHAKPQALVAKYLDEAQDLGLRVVQKKSWWGDLSKMSTTYYKEIRVGSDWEDLTPSDRAILLAHELRHARQWRRYGVGTFRTRYIFWPRWRWAVEVQCYCESVRALTALGASDAVVARYIESRPKVLWDHYVLKVLRKSDVMTHTRRVLLTVLD